MAVDTRQDRQSSVGILLPWDVPGVDPAVAGIDAAESQAAAHTYSGILAGAPALNQFDIKRISAAGFLMPFYVRGAIIDGDLPQTDRQSVALIYAGILAGEPAPEPVDEGDLLDVVNVVTDHIRVLR